MELASQAGGLDPSLGVNVVAEDGYAMTFSYDQITQGDFIAYDPATGDEKKMSEPLKVILAYAREEDSLDKDSDGTLRLAIISPKNNQVTDGHWSVKWVNRLEIKPLGAEWDLQLTGIISDTVDRNSFQSCAASLCHQGSWTYDKAKSGSACHSGIWWDAWTTRSSTMTRLHQALADTGYAIQLIATDGYSTTLQSSQVTRNNDLVLAYQVNENPLPDKYFPLRLVGNELQKNQLIGQVAEIKMIFDAAAAAPALTPTSPPAAAATSAPATVQGDLVIFGLVDNPLGLDEADLRKMEVIELTAEHPKKGKETYQGIRLGALLELAGLKPEASKLVFSAADGYTAELSVSDLQACTDCLLAFTNTPGKFKLVMPGMESSLWVKDIASIEAR